jgi:hypothetical protein
VTHHPSFQVTTYVSNGGVDLQKYNKPKEQAPEETNQSPNIPPQHLDVALMNSSLAPDLMILSYSSMNNMSLSATQ